MQNVRTSALAGKPGRPITSSHHLPAGHSDTRHLQPRVAPFPDDHGQQYYPCTVVHALHIRHIPGFVLCETTYCFALQTTS